MRSKNRSWPDLHIRNVVGGCHGVGTFVQQAGRGRILHVLTYGSGDGRSQPCGAKTGCDRLLPFRNSVDGFCGIGGLVQKPVVTGFYMAWHMVAVLSGGSRAVQKPVVTGFCLLGILLTVVLVLAGLCTNRS